VDDEGNAYVTGKTRSPNFPTKGPYQTDQSIEDVYVTKIAPSGRSLVYSTYLGGNGIEYAHDVCTDKAGNAYVAGWTSSTNFPTVKPFQRDQPDWGLCNEDRLSQLLSQTQINKKRTMLYSFTQFP
jgi:hypothetical protein